MIHKNMEDRSVSFDGFSGMDASGLFGAGKTYTLKNFRLLSDGSIEKREGYRHIATLPDTARAVYVLDEGDRQALLCVAGSYLCRLSEEGELTTASVFSATEGRVLFLRYGKKLYILDGERLYRYDGGVEVTAGEAYIPLLGKDWRSDDSQPGDVYESPNLLTRRALITYSGDQETIYDCYFDRQVASVDEVYIGSQKISPSKYTLEDDGTRLAFRLGVETDERTLKVHVTLAEGGAALSATQTFFFEGLNTDRLFLYGGDDPSTIYGGYTVLNPEVTQMKDGFNLPLYFPASLASSFGEGGRVNAIRRMGNRLLVFSERGVHLSKEELSASKRGEFVSLSQSVGCSSPEGLLVLNDEEVVCVDKSGILQVTVDPSMERECAVKSLSSQARDAFGENFLTTARPCYFRTRDEIWFVGSSDKGEVFVYRPSDGCWYGFTGIRADFLQTFGGKTFFVDGAFVNFFAEDAKVDEAAYGNVEIPCVFKSHYFDFGAPEADKRLSGLLLLAVLDGGELEVRLSDGGYLAEFTVEDGTRSTFSHLYEKHLRSGRFRFASLELHAAGAARQRIFGAKVFV